MTGKSGEDKAARATRKGGDALGFTNVLDKHSFGIYLIHMPVLVCLFRIIGSGDGMAEIVGRTVLYGAASFAVSLVICAALKKVPWVKNWI